MEYTTDRSNEIINFNRSVHDQIVNAYDEERIEIFNSTEQKRIQAAFQDAVSRLNKLSGQVRALDFGAGTGNLTKHLIELGAKVTSADVSSGCLAKIRDNVSCLDKLEIYELNGKDLTGIPDESFDLVATYSVLHHVPDYLRVIDEFVRVASPGGIIIIDHEVCSAYWQSNGTYLTYMEELGGRFSSDYLYLLGLKPKLHGEMISSTLIRIKKIFSLKAWKELFENMIKSKEREISSDGDIHVFPDDHIEWDLIRSRLEPYCEILRDEDYLVCRERTDVPSVWNKWCDKVSDMHFLMVRKR